MKQKSKFITIIALGLSSLLVYAGTITDTYTTGDTLTATKMNNIKSAVNDNDFNISTNTANIVINSSDIADNASRLPAMKSVEIDERLEITSNIFTTYFLTQPLVVTPKTQGYIYIEANASYNCTASSFSQSDFGIYISATSTPPTNQTAFTHFETYGYAFSLDSSLSGGNINARITYPLTAVAGQEYYIWYGVRGANISAPFCKVGGVTNVSTAVRHGYPRITARFFQFGL